VKGQKRKGREKKTEPPIKISLYATVDIKQKYVGSVPTYCSAAVRLDIHCVAQP